MANMAQEAKTDSLEERLKSHSKSFDGLLSLIPAKYYYGEDNSDQWQRKKQTKEQKRAAKLAKLDPENAKTAKDVLDEQAAEARKRKREEDELEEEISTVGGVTPEEPLAHQINDRQQVKKQRIANKEDPVGSKSDGLDSGNNSKSDQKTLMEIKQQEKAMRRKAKAERKAAKSEAKKSRKQQEQKAVVPVKVAKNPTDLQKAPLNEGDRAELGSVDIDSIEIEVGDTAEDAGQPGSTRSPSPEARSSACDNSNPHSGSSSISSIMPPPTAPPPAKKANPEELKARLAMRIEALRAARKADNTDGAPARSRQELIEVRRRKEEERKAHKKELRRKAKEEERRKHEETILRGSPLLSGSPLVSPGSPAGSPVTPNNFSFGRISFANGQRATSSLSNIITPNKPKGPSDPRTALQSARNQESRLADLDPARRAEVAEKEAWLHAKQRAEGAKVRDDSSLLKKTLKRKEKQKKKSEREWGERTAGVEKSKAAKQKKREANLAKRREDKGARKSGGKGGKSAKGTTPRQARPGFEGTFRAKAPRGVGGDKPRRR